MKQSLPLWIRKKKKGKGKKKKGKGRLTQASLQVPWKTKHRDRQTHTEHK